MSSSLSRREFVRRAALVSAAASIPTPVFGSMFSNAQGSPRAGALVMIELPGPTLDAATRNLIRRHRIRAVVLFRKNIVNSRQVRNLNRALREEMGEHALIAIDQEGGGVVRTLDLPFPPSAMSLGASNDPNLAEQVGAATGRALADLGFNWNFAPVLDVNNNPLNPVIGDRSFGSDPFLVSELGMAWARGCQSAGVATCVKHFPGHGDTTVDSHLGLPVVSKTVEELHSLELQPFRAAAESGIPCFMTSHILYPSLDPEYPATLSRRILTGVLREKWGYDGVIITDSMPMQAISRNYRRDDATRLSLLAGADMIMALGTHRDTETSIQAINRAIESGALSEVDRQQRVARLNRLAERYPVAFSDYERSMRTHDTALLSHAWGRGLTEYGHPLPPRAQSKVTLVVAGDPSGGGAADMGLAGPALSRLVEKQYEVDTVFYNRRRPMSALSAFRSVSREEGRTVVFASTGRLRPTDELRRFIAGVRPDLHIALWNPYTVLDVQAPALIAYGFRPEALERVVAWMVGRQDANGVLPVEMRG
jgi:beta-N-acetylhexosaminidase